MYVFIRVESTTYAWQYSALRTLASFCVFFCYGVTVQVFYESLRMYPPTPAVSRQALCGMKLAGYSIPEGTNILVSTRLSDSYTYFNICRFHRM